MSTGHDRETRAALILTWASRFNTALAAQLMLSASSAVAVMEAKDKLRDIMENCPQRLADALKDTAEAEEKADRELEFIVRHGVRVLTIGSEEYPKRLATCEDAPPVLFVLGNADLDATHVVSVIGTRRCSPYGQDCVNRLVGGLKEKAGRVLVVSGLAYGIDIAAHRAALKSGLDTVAVLAHGLDNLYPSAHRDTAAEMLAHGGLVTEFFTQTQPDRLNFLRRNRIVAGLADAVVVAESAYRGGALATARIATSYNRDVFAFPGRVCDETSEGCNNLIRDNKAALITSAADLVSAMMWEKPQQEDKGKDRAVELPLFPELTPDEQKIVNLLSKTNDQQVNTLAINAGMEAKDLQPVIFSLEMKGIIRVLAGSTYHLNG